MRKKLAFRKTISRMRSLLCLLIAMFATFGMVTAIQEAHHDFPNSSTVKALAYISPMADYVRAASCPTVSAGASVSAISSAMATCNTSGGGTVFMGGGGYSIGSIFTVPCNVTLSGPVLTYKQTHYQTAILTGSVTQPIHTTPGCANPQNLSYFEWNGNQQNNGGGGIYVTPGTNHLVIDHVFMHGATGPAVNGCCGEAQILLAGGGGTISNPTQNVQITMSEFGPEATSADCGAAMTETDTEASQGLCVGILSDTFTKNVSWDHNIFQNMEEGAKVVEATTNGGSSLNSGNTNNFTVSYNYFYNIQRINYESQSNYYNTSFPTTQFVNYNVSGNRWTGGGGQQNFELSIANGCGNPPATPNCSANADFNIDVQNASTNHGAGNEFWGDSNSHMNYNLFEGYVAYGAGGSIDWAQSGAFVFNNNTFNQLRTGTTNCQTASGSNTGYWNQEDSGASKPACTTGNTFSGTGSGTYTSVIPTITVSGANWTVTFPTAANRDLNTNGWCTIDGSSPVPGAGTAAFYAAGTGGLTSAVTGGSIKCVGMWGAQNQPTSYPTNYGYVPSAVVTQAVTGNQYYISPTGSDSNNGTSASTPWLSPNHTVNCGATITAAAGTYSATNFQSGKWGTVAGCGTGNAANVAWVTCATFDACKISTSGQSAVQIGAPYWGISGFEASTTSPGYACFNVQPSGTTSVHHIIFANDVCNSAYGGGFQATQGSSGPTVDYINFIGNIAYNAAQGSDQCHSGLTLGFIKQLDTNAGTHILIAGNYAWNNFNPNPCAGTAPTDGEGMELDTLDQYDYSGQVVVENNIFAGNGGRGLNVNNNNNSPYAPVYLKNNTTYGNNLQAGQEFPLAHGDIEMTQVNGVTATNNIAMPSQGTTGGDAIYAYAWNPVGTGNSVAGNWLYSAAGNTTYGSGYGTNTTGTNPAFANPAIPGAPSCSGKLNVPACAATLIANFTPTASGASTYGYQTPSSVSVTDPLYPQWLCNVTLPSGLLTPGCGGAPSPTLTGGYQGNSLTPPGNTLTVGAAAIQQTAYGQYSSGTTPIAFNTTTNQDPYGNTVTWSSSAPLILNVTSTGKISCLTNGTASSLVTANPGGIIFNQWVWTCSGSGPAATPVISPVTGTYTSSQTVTMTTTTPGASIYYTTNGTTPNTGSTLYTGAFSVVVTTTVNAIAAASGYTNSAVATSVITISPAPTITQVYLQISNGKPINYIPVGGTVQFVAEIQYSDGTTLPSTIVGVPNARGDSISAWNSNNTPVITITNQGIATGISLGQSTMMAVINGSVNSSIWYEYVSTSITDEMTGQKFRGGIFLSALPRLKPLW